MPTITKLTIYKSLIVGVLIVFIGLTTQLFVASSSIETRIGLDSLFKLRGTIPPPTEVVIVAIDKVASSHYGFDNEPLAWSRDYHAKIINRLNQAGARTIVFDIFFKRPRDSKNDIIMSKAIKESSNVILFAKLKRQLLNTSGKTPQTLNQENVLSIETIQSPLKIFSDAALSVAPFTLPKFPAKVTRFWTFRSTSGDTPTLPLIALHHYLSPILNPYLQEANLQNVINSNASINIQIKHLRENFINNTEEYQKFKKLIASQNNIALKSILATYTGTSQPYLNFYGAPRNITTFTYDQVLENRLPNNFSFKDKVVFIGFSEKLEPEQKDNFNTVFSQENGLDLSGIEIAATAFSNLLHNSTIKPVSNSTALIIIICFGFVVAFASRICREYIAILLCLGLSASYLYIATYQFNQNYLWLPLFVPLVVQAPLALIFGISWYALDSYRARKKMRRAFSYYVPESMVDFLTEQKQSIQHSQELQYGVCMATDAEQYTQLSERLVPEDLAKLMNQYYETLFSTVRKNNGIVSDIIGDAMLALWLPKKIKTNQKSVRENSLAEKVIANEILNTKIKSCLAGIEIIKSHNKKYLINNQSIILPTRIGLHAGEMMVGNIGAVDHYEYRAVGDVINTTTRIESLNKYFSTFLLASEEVMNKTDMFLARNIGNFILAGKQHAISLYEIIKLKENASSKERQEIDDFHQALAFFKQGLFKEAEMAFISICKSIPTDGVARFYLQQCQQQRTIPASEDWDGTIKFTQK